jgi:release factor glutamine methyltransferase
VDGLVAYRAILARLDGILSARGAAFLEVGAGQAQPVSELAEVLGFETDRHKDLVGIDRVVELRRGETSR